MTERDFKAAPTPEERSKDVDEVEVFLDATTMRSRIEFDPDFARSLVKMISQAAEIVEESRSINLDKPSPHSIRSVAAYNELLLKRQAALETTALAKAAARLRHEIARESAEIHRLTNASQAIRSAPQEISDDPRLESSEGLRHAGSTPLLSETTDEAPADSVGGELSPTRVLLIGGIPISVTAMGGGLLVESALNTPVVPNPYIALFVFLSGLALIATALVALSERKQD